MTELYRVRDYGSRLLNCEASQSGGILRSQALGKSTSGKPTKQTLT